MVYTTQQVSLRSILFIPLPLTSIHDIYGAWNGLCSSLIVLYKQLELPPGSSIILVVALYLAGIATIHITTPALLSLQFHNVTTIQNITVLGPYNYSLPEDPPTMDVAINVQQLNLTGVAGLHENIFYEVPDSNSNVHAVSGNANVTALSFSAKCGPLGEAKEDFKMSIIYTNIGFEMLHTTGLVGLGSDSSTPWGLYQSSQPMFLC
jgi:hypothetical protein